jgi:hypothetical protein
VRNSAPDNGAVTYLLNKRCVVDCGEKFFPNAGTK